MNRESIAKLIDHALLHPTLSDEEIRDGCRVAKRLGVASVCVKPYALPIAVEELDGSGVAVGTVIGFPHGSHSTACKTFEAHNACELGATELDMVVNVGKALSGDWGYVEADIRAVVQAGHEHGALVKVILETDFLPDDETKRQLCLACNNAGADFIKTSTGFGFTKQPQGGYGYHGATEADIRLMRKYANENVQIKASGGIRTYEDAVKMRELGCTRLGSSSSEEIVTGEQSNELDY
jgi:deoxyribose-phosphate aldolase